MVYSDDPVNLYGPVDSMKFICSKNKKMSYCSILKRNGEHSILGNTIFVCINGDST